jgi:hypothetical protein
VTRHSLAACIAAAVLAAGPAASHALAQDHGTAPAHAAPAKAAAPAKPVASPPPPRGPVIAPAKPLVTPRVGPMGDATLPTARRNPKTNQVTVSARQAAEKTIAALVEAMKSIPKRPPAPPEPRTSSARRAANATRAVDPDAPPPINYHVTWPARPEEVGVTKRVELAWPGSSTSGVSLRWNEPTR